MASTDHASTLLTSIQDQRTDAPLSIVALAEPILLSSPSSFSGTSTGTKAGGPHTQLQHGERNRDSHDSSAAEARITPAALAADLSHYQSLFSKLRFSYLEQVTKEKYLRSIVGDPPLLVSHEDNTALEEKLAGMKSELKTKKENNNALVRQIEALAADVALRYEGVDAGVEGLGRLPVEVAAMEAQVADLRQLVQEKEDEMDIDFGIDRNHDDKSDQNKATASLGLSEIEDHLDQQRRQLAEVEAEIEALQKDMPGKIRECERTERELEELETKRNEVTKIVRDVRRIKEEGGRDLLEEQGRWCKSSEIVLRNLFGVYG